MTATIPSPVSQDTLLDRYIRLKKRKKKLDQYAKGLNAAIDETEAAILEEWDASGTQQIKKHGVTLFKQRDLSVKTDTVSLTAVLIQEQDLRFLLGPVAQRLKAQVKEWCFNEEIGEWELNKDKVPEAIRDLIEMKEYNRLNNRGL